MTSFDRLIANNNQETNAYGGGAADNSEQEEMFSLEKSKEQEEYTLVNVRIDYEHRGNQLEHMSLYEYVSSIYRKKIDASDRCYLDKSENVTTQTVGAQIDECIISIIAFIRFILVVPETKDIISTMDILKPNLICRYIGRVLAFP